MSILDILNELADEPSTNAKVKTLEREKNNELLKRVFQAAYNKTITYGIKKIPDIQVGMNAGKITLGSALNDISRLSTREFTGNAAIEFLSNILYRLDSKDSIVIQRVIARDLRCGCSDSLASRVWPNLVPTFDVMLCGKDITKIKFPAYSQTKFDGCRVHLVWDGKHATAWSRAGKEFNLLNVFDEDFKKMHLNPNTTLDGELIVVRNGKVVDRKTGNGILNQANKGTITQEDAESVVICAWDVVDQTSTIPYRCRLEILYNAAKNLDLKRIWVADTLLVNNVDEAMADYAVKRKNGQEGTIVKNIMHKWVPKRTNELCKLKAIETADLIVIGIEEGTGKYKGMVGSYLCQTSDGKMEVSVGTGLTDVDRANPLKIGTIIEVLYNEVIQSKGKDKASLFLPRFVDARFDKTVANSFEELK